MTPENDNELASDLIRGAESFAAFLGPDFTARSIYHACSKGNLPHFYIGSMLCGRKSTIRAFIAAQEMAGTRAAA